MALSMMRKAAGFHQVDADQIATVVEEMDRVVGSLDNLILRGQDVMLGVFVRPSTKKTASGLVLYTGGTGADQTEDTYQGVICRVLKLGPMAFNVKHFPSVLHEWGDAEAIPKVGDWVFVQATTGIQASYKGTGSQRTTMFESAVQMPDDGGWPVRIVAFSDVIGKVSDPSVLV